MASPTLAAERFGVISADSHVLEPPELWARYIEPRFRERAPRMVRRDGHDEFEIDGLAPIRFGNQSAAGVDPEDIRVEITFEEAFRGGWDPAARLADMDKDQIDAEVLYPSFCFPLWQLADRPYQQACMAAYNDWMADFTAGGSGRLVGNALISLEDVDQAVRELQRVAARGLRGACISSLAPAARPYGHPHYERFWAAAQDLRMPLSLHVFTGTRPEMDASVDFLTGYALLPSAVQGTIGQLICSGVLQRFPGLRLISVELDIGWIPTFLRRLDHAWEHHRHWSGAGRDLELPPSEYFRRGVAATFMDDAAGLRVRELCGVDALMWSSDYPHPDSTWPHSREAIERQFRGIPEAERRKITHDNVLRIYGLA